MTTPDQARAIAANPCTRPLCHIRKLSIAEHMIGPDKWEWRVICIGCHNTQRGSTRANAVAAWDSANPLAILQEQSNADTC